MSRNKNIFKLNVFGVLDKSPQRFSINNAKNESWTTAQKVDTILGFQKETKMRVYTKEFKLESVRLYIANGKNKKKTARELGITAVTLNNWIGKYMNEALDKSKERPKKRDYEKELKEKDKLIQRLEDEVLILKKSIGIFTKDSQQK